MRTQHSMSCATKYPVWSELQPAPHDPSLRPFCHHWRAPPQTRPQRLRHAICLHWSGYMFVYGCVRKRTRRPHFKFIQNKYVLLFYSCALLRFVPAMLCHMRCDATQIAVRILRCSDCDHSGCRAWIHILGLSSTVKHHFIPSGLSGYYGAGFSWWILYAGPFEKTHTHWIVDRTLQGLKGNNQEVFGPSTTDTSHRWLKLMICFKDFLNLTHTGNILVNDLKGAGYSWFLWCPWISVSVLVGSASNWLPDKVRQSSGFKFLDVNH